MTYEGLMHFLHRIGPMQAAIWKQMEAFEEINERRGLHRQLGCMLNAGVGMALWGLGAVACGLSQGFWTLLFSRMLVGSGTFPALPAHCMAACIHAERRTWLAPVTFSQILPLPAANDAHCII